MRTLTTWQDVLRPGTASDFFSRDPLPRFDPSATGFGRQNASWLAELCRLVYRHDVEEDDPPPLPRRSELLAKAGLRQVAFFNSAETGTQGFLVQSDRPPSFAALVFRGTEQNPRDFANDLIFPPVPWAGGTGKVHRGFFLGLESVWAPISVSLSGLVVPVFYTGHSLGAALATLAAARRPPAALYTFGSPLVGDPAFAATLSQVPVFRVVDGSDLVTKVPPAELGFAHVGEEHRLARPPGPSPLRHPLLWLRSWLSPPPALADRFGIGRPQWMNDSVIGVIIFLAVRFLPWAILGTLFSGWYSGWIHGLERETQAHPLALPSGYAEHTLLIVAVGLGAFTEELVFRGYLIPRLRQLGTGLIPAVLVSSVLFGSIHLYQGPWWSSLHCVEGLVYGTLFLVAGRLWPVVIAHALFNLNVFDWAAAGAMHLR